jgi:hypothetical protein
MNKLTFKEYIAAIPEARSIYPRWREGQTYFNVLYMNRPDLSEQVRATDLDPFHNDESIQSFLTWVGENWNGNKTP